jgi:hypothetical protein
MRFRRVLVSRPHLEGQGYDDRLVAIHPRVAAIAQVTQIAPPARTGAARWQR